MHKEALELLNKAVGASPKEAMRLLDECKALISKSLVYVYSEAEPGEHGGIVGVFETLELAIAESVRRNPNATSNFENWSPTQWKRPSGKVYCYVEEFELVTK